MRYNPITFVELKQIINFGDDSYKKDIVLKPGLYEVIEWSYHNQTHTDYEYDYVDLIEVNTRKRIHFILYHPDRYGKLFTVHTEFILCN